MNESTAYLQGIRVLDFTQYLAGPACTRLLAEMGAEVIKVELAPYGDPGRAMHPRVNKRSSYYVQQNRGKKSVCVDLSRPRSRELLLSLIPHVDIVVENYSPGVMARRGMGWEDLHALNPRLVMASISGFGQTGPLSANTSFDFIAQAYSGVMHMTGEADGPPTMVGVALGDTNAGVHAFAAIGYALFRRDRTGQGSHLDIAMVDALFHMQEMAVHAPSATKGEWVAHRTGNHYGSVAPAGLFQGPDGYIAILCGQNQIDALWAAMGQPELAEDPRFRTDPARRANLGDLIGAIEAWMATFPSDTAVIAALEAHRVPCGPVLSPTEAVKHPHFVERGTVRTVTDPFVGEIQVPGFPIRFSDAPPEVDLQTAALGQHNHSVLSAVAGLTDDAIAEFQADGVLVAKDR